MAGILTGFETGDTSEAITTSGTFSVQGTTTRGAWSAYALRINLAAFATGFVRFAASGATGQASTTGLAAATAYTRFYFRVDTLPGTGSEEFFRAVTNSASVIVILRITDAGNIAAYGSDGATLLTTGTAVLSTAVWYRIELKNGNGAGAALEWKIDGVTDVSTTATLGTGNINQVTFGKQVDRNGQSVDYYYDDIRVSDSAYPGEGQCAILKPNAAGNYQTWSRGGADSGSNWGQVDEIPHNTDTDYLVSTDVADEAETEGLEPASTHSISGTINCVKAVGIVKRDGASNGEVRLRARSGSTDSDTASNYATTASYALIAMLLDADPADAGAWTAGDLDALEVGAVEKNATNRSRLTMCAVMVDWTPAAPASGFVPHLCGRFVTVGRPLIGRGGLVI